MDRVNCVLEGLFAAEFFKASHIWVALYRTKPRLKCLPQSRTLIMPMKCGLTDQYLKNHVLRHQLAGQDLNVLVAFQSHFFPTGQSSYVDTKGSRAVP